jgi:SAM-dependent methyltransferase
MGNSLNLDGDRDIEWSFVATHMPTGNGGWALDFGCGRSPLALVAIERGFRVLGLDMEAITPTWSHDAYRFRKGDLLEISFARESFDLIINCSAIEHVGLAGRFGISQPQPDGDWLAMRKLRTLMKTGGIQLLTLPVGVDADFPPWHRVYGEQRMPLLLSGYEVKEESYWRKSVECGWRPCTRADALSFEPPCTDERSIYALGCMVLARG